MKKFSQSEMEIIDTLSRCEDIENAAEHYLRLKSLRELYENKHSTQDLSKFLNALGNQDRLLILDSLREQDRCTCKLEAILGKSQSTTSHHLKILEEVKLISGWKKGKFTHYSLIKSRFTRFKDLFEEWLSHTINWLQK